MTFFAYGALPWTAPTTRPPPASATSRTAGSWNSSPGSARTPPPRPPSRAHRDHDRAGGRAGREIAALRAELDFGIDGIVVKADAAADQADAGVSPAPRWAIAYKLPAVEKITRLLDVEWNVGRTGVIAPRAVLEPVEVDGSTVTYATLHNAADIERRGLMIGDHVTVYKAGDVIPRVEAPVVHLRSGEERPIAVPAACPRCGDEIDASQQRWRCVRGRSCHAVASVRYAVGRDQLDIEGLGENRIDQLVDADLITDFADLFSSPTTRSSPSIGWGDQHHRAARRHRGRQGQAAEQGVLRAGRARYRPVDVAAHSPPLRHDGRDPRRRRRRVPGGRGRRPERATILVAEIAELACLIDKLVAADVTMTEPGAAAPTDEAGPDTSDLPLAGLSIVATGSMSGPLEGLSRNQVNELIERAAGQGLLLGLRPHLPARRGRESGFQEDQGGKARRRDHHPGRLRHPRHRLPLTWVRRCGRCGRCGPAS